MVLLNNTKQRQVLVYVINVDWYFELHWLQRALASLKTGYEVHLVMAFTDNDIHDRLNGYGFICHPWAIDRKSLNPLFNFKGFVDLYGYLKSISPNIIHAITIKPNIYVGLLVYLLNKPYVLSVTGTGTVFSGQSLTIRMVKPLIRLLYKSLKTGNGLRRIVFENGEDKHYFVDTGLCADQEAAIILGAGVDTDLYKPVPEAIANTPIILFAARLLWDKGLGDLVAAAKLLRAQGLSFLIQVAGIIDKSTINAIDERILEDWHREGWITWLGTEKNMPKLIAQANIVVLPTFYGEGVPRILIEAASCQRAIVTTDMPGCREIVKHDVNGLLVPAQNSNALAGAIAKLIQNPGLRKTMGQRGREMVEKDFSEQHVIKQTLSLYAELLS
ncbi:MAG: glycosyltransferase family 4 protein [Methylococcales bacterium]